MKQHSLNSTFFPTHKKRIFSLRTKEERKKRAILKCRGKESCLEENCEERK
jgi:hypothetical protein